MLYGHSTVHITVHSTVHITVHITVHGAKNINNVIIIVVGKPEGKWSRGGTKRM